MSLKPSQVRKKRKEMLRHLMTEEESARWNPE